MDSGMVLDITRSALTTLLTVAAPLLGISLVVGLVVSILQATTQIQEQTLTFVPKILAIAAILIFFGSWMLGKLIDYTVYLFNLIPQMVG